MTGDNTTKLFMWGFQQHMLNSFQVSSEQVFDKIDVRLRPRVFFLGILIEKTENQHPICLEPEDCGFSVIQFNKVKNLASELSATDPERSILHSHPQAQNSSDKRAIERAYIEAIRKTLKKTDFENLDSYHVANPAYIGGYMVFTVLVLSQEIYGQLYSLTKNNWDRFPILRSFPESVVKEYLKECTTELKDPNRGMPDDRRSADEIFRSAGRSFMYTVALAGNNFDGIHHFYEACNEIASLKYEGAVGLGSLVVASKDHKNIRMTLELGSPIKVGDFRMVRKFLEISDNNSIIICDSALIYGLGEIQGRYNPKEENLFTISFTSYFNWTVSHDGNPLMEVAYRQPSLPREKIDRDAFYSDFRRIFMGILKPQLDDLWEAVNEATDQKHGTMIVISDQAQTEAQRLGSQSFPINPMKLSRAMVKNITSIDGALLLDRDARCHAIGVILDGPASEKGNPARGARYNSAIRYYEQFKDSKSLALVIVSEDGMINLLPSLRPQIHHSDIENAINDLVNVLKKETFDIKTFNRTMSYFSLVNFYLTKKECDNINVCRKEIENKFKGGTQLRILYEDLKPSSEMNESYYIQKNK